MKKESALGNKRMTRLKNKEGVEEYERARMNQIATEFYSDLFSVATRECDFNVSVGDGIAPDPPFLEDEVRRAANVLEEGKAAGHDGITDERIKFGGYLTIKISTKLYNEIVETRTKPSSWKLSNIILIFEKSSSNDIKNYRPIGLMPTLAKILSTMLDFHLRGILK